MGFRHVATRVFFVSIQNNRGRWTKLAARNKPSWNLNDSFIWSESNNNYYAQTPTIKSVFDYYVRIAWTVKVDFIIFAALQQVAPKRFDHYAWNRKSFVISFNPPNLKRKQKYMDKTGRRWQHSCISNLCDLYSSFKSQLWGCSGYLWSIAPRKLP